MPSSKRSELENWIDYAGLALDWVKREFHNFDSSPDILNKFLPSLATCTFPLRPMGSTVSLQSWYSVALSASFAMKR